jgi:hypothetical protein
MHKYHKYKSNVTIPGTSSYSQREFLCCYQFQLSLLWPTFWKLCNFEVWNFSETGFTIAMPTEITNRKEKRAKCQTRNSKA